MRKKNIVFVKHFAAEFIDKGEHIFSDSISCLFTSPLKWLIDTAYRSPISLFSDTLTKDEQDVLRKL